MPSKDQKTNGTRWKAVQAGYDEILIAPADTSECSYCLSANEVELIQTQLEPMHWWTRWYSKSDAQIDMQLIDDFVSNLEYKLMSGCCGSDRVLRITADGTVQSSQDGGVTWVDSPQDDPRNFVTQSPPLAGDDGSTKRCAAANSAAAYFKQEQQAVLAAKEESAGLSDIAAIIIGFLLIIGIIASGGIFAILGAALAVIAANLDASTFEAAFTDTTWATLVNILYCRMNNDASISPAQWNDVKNDIIDQISGTAGSWLLAAVNQVGSAGLQNAARLGLVNDPDVNCDAFGCETCSGKFAIWNADGSDLAYGTDEDGDYVQVTSVLDAPNFGGYVIAVTTNGPSVCCGLYLVKPVGADATGGAWLWQECGHAIPVIGSVPFDHTGLLPNVEQLTNTVARNSSTAFTLKLYFA